MKQEDITDLPDDIQVVGEGQYHSRCKTCEQDEGSPTILYLSDNPQDVKREARDHREWHSSHRPVARGPDGEQIYG